MTKSFVTPGVNIRFLVLANLMERSKTSHRRPTEAECTILNVLWERGSATVREVYEELSARQQMGYTTVLKFMQIMTEKGLIERDATVRPQIFSPAREKTEVQNDMVRDLLDRVFGGSTESLVLRALDSRPSSPEELAAIRQHLDELEREAS